MLRRSGNIGGFRLCGGVEAEPSVSRPSPTCQALALQFEAMPTPAVPKYQAIYLVLRQRILDGELAPGSRLASQQELANEFGVTVMTLRQAIAALEAEGLLWAARGKGTFVADRPVDVGVGNLSSFAEQMNSVGLDLSTEVLAIDTVSASAHPEAAAALETAEPLSRMLRRRRVKGVPISLQRSFLAPGAVSIDLKNELAGYSLYDAIKESTGWEISEARETVTAVGLDASDAEMLETEPGHPAMLSIRTSIQQFGRPYLYDEALLVGGRCSIAADRTVDRLAIEYTVDR